MFEKLKENKTLKIIGNILYAVLVILVVLILAVVLLQRVSDNNISLGGIRIFNIVSESMVPKYEIGDILISVTTPAEELKVGDDIVYKGEKGDFTGKIVTHQIIAIEKNTDGTYTITTKGIANELEDPTITDAQVYGKVIYKVQTLSFISKIINNLYSFYFVIFIPVVILIFIEIRRIIKNFKQDDDEDDEQEDEDNDSEDEDKQDKKDNTNKNEDGQDDEDKNEDE